ncbi:hypothetical protein AB4Y40_07345 [Paraburkholderia sp. EG287B]|uniref:hypothetical protein n=1 Tax=Paraburkholderia sp. EG287B TaxID=3237010 RepID=UPI0034D29A8A
MTRGVDRHACRVGWAFERFEPVHVFAGCVQRLAAGRENMNLRGRRDHPLGDDCCCLDDLFAAVEHDELWAIAKPQVIRQRVQDVVRVNDEANRAGDGMRYEARVG